MVPPTPNFDARDDARLRAVPVPEGLVDRLRLIALEDDAGLDSALRDVSVPPGFMQRLHGSMLEDDDALDAAIRDVAVPTQLSSRLQRSHPGSWMRVGRLTQWATAASLLIVIGLSYAGVIAAFLLATAPPADDSLPQPGSQVAQSPRDPERPTPRLGLGVSSPGEGRLDGVVRNSVASVPEVDPWGPGGRPLAEVDQVFGPPDARALSDPPFTDHGENLLASHDMLDELPEFGTVPGLVQRGIVPPLGSNIQFLFRYGVHPFVAPVVYPSAASGYVPLAVDTTSYELTRRYLRRGELPPPGEVRTEEFLAALDYDFPIPKGKALGLFTAAGPSPFGGEGVCVFQVGVRAGPLQEIVAGESPRVAENVRLKVTFNPKTVVAYRLLGHEADPMPPLALASVEAELLAGQSATVVYEVCLTPGESGGMDVATVELSWQDPSGERGYHHDTRGVRRDQFAYTFAEAPPALQAAALAAETAEVLRESPFAAVSRNLRSRALSHVLEVARHTDPSLRERPCFTELLSLVEQARKARRGRKGASR